MLAREQGNFSRSIGVYIAKVHAIGSEIKKMAYTRDAGDNIKNIGGSVAEQMSSAAISLADKAASKINDAVDRAESTAAAVAERGRDAEERVQQVAGNLRTAVDKSVKEQPMATLAVAAMMGLVIGALWKS